MRLFLFISLFLTLLHTHPAYSLSVAQNAKKISQRIHTHLNSELKRKSPSLEKKLGYQVYRRNQCLADDFDIFKIETNKIIPLVRDIRQKHIESLPNSIKTSRFDFATSKVEKTTDGLSFASLQTLTNPSHTFADYLNGFEQINAFNLEIFDYLIHNKDRDAQNNIKYAVLFASLDLRGIAKQQTLHDQLDVKLFVERTTTDWQLVSIEFHQGLRISSSRAPAFIDETQSFGLAAIPTNLRREAIRRGGYSLAITDINSDGIQDLYAGTGAKGALFTGKKDKNALRFTPAESDVTASTFVKSSVFADFDNDGDQDAVLIRFIDKAKSNKQLVYFENKNGVLTENSQAFKDFHFHGNYAMPAAVGDFNKDHLLDLYVGFPGRDDFTTLKNNPHNAQAHGLFYNTQGRSFVYRNEKLLLTRDEANVFPHSAIAVDYDQDKNTDILIIDDRNNLSPLLKNQGDSFTQVASDVGLGNNGYGMSIAAGDFNGDGLIDFAMTNVVARSDERFVNGCLRNWNIRPLSNPEKGLRLFQNLGGGKFSDVTSASNISWAGGGTGGILFFDYNNDGLDDLYVVNGVWSGNNPDFDLSSAWTYLHTTDYFTDEYKYSSSPSHSDLMSLLINYQGDLYTNTPMKGMNPSFIGFQHNKLFRNLGKGRFVDVSHVENIDRLEDGYAVVSTDLNADGKMDLVLRNADPGVETNLFSPVKLFINQHAEKNNFLVFKLSASHSNRDAIGTEVVVTTPDNKQVKQLIANNGPQQNERILHFGIGKNTRADVRIVWPDGGETYLKGLKPGLHTLNDSSGRKKMASF